MGMLGKRQEPGEVWHGLYKEKTTWEEEEKLDSSEKELGKAGQMLYGQQMVCLLSSSGAGP